ncbi:MAG: TetR/AcrR family transcriptional regulator [Peptococcaceae bacterium]|nr:TetR/AcrR family transcriptional regulator [Peptococcaceae bacterium]
MTRITKPPEERRQEIIDTAMRVFYEKGYEKTSISDIAREMHVAQGLCYRYFPSKEALFDTALDQYAELQVKRLCANMQPDMTLTELIATAPSFLETENDDSYAQKFYHHSGNAKFHWQLSLKICAKLQPIVADFLHHASARGEIRLADPDTAASFFVYGQLGILLDQKLSANERVTRLRAFLLDMIEKYQ